MENDLIALFELNFDGDDVSIVQERHYRLTESKDITEKDLSAYRSEGRTNISDVVKRIKPEDVVKRLKTQKD